MLIAVKAESDVMQLNFDLGSGAKHVLATLLFSQMRCQDLISISNDLLLAEWDVFWNKNPAQWIWYL